MKSHMRYSLSQIKRAFIRCLKLTHQVLYCTVLYCTQMTQYTNTYCHFATTQTGLVTKNQMFITEPISH